MSIIYVHVLLYSPVPLFLDAPFRLSTPTMVGVVKKKVCLNTVLGAYIVLSRHIDYGKLRRIVLFVKITILLDSVFGVLSLPFSCLTL